LARAKGWNFAVFPHWRNMNQPGLEKGVRHAVTHEGKGRKSRTEAEIVEDSARDG